MGDYASGDEGWGDLTYRVRNKIRHPKSQSRGRCDMWSPAVGHSLFFLCRWPTPLIPLAASEWTSAGDPKGSLMENLAADFPLN